MAADETTPRPKSSDIARRLSTILAADVAGYSRMMGENEEATVQTLRRHRAIFDALLQQHHGRVFNTAGDMILAEFGSAVEAVRCATEIQAALQTRNEQLPVAQRMLFRMGINLGDVIVENDDLLGDGVNVAARLQSIAEPGGICVSGSVYDQILNKLSLRFRPLGKQTLKNIALPVRTFSIARDDVGGVGLWPSPHGGWPGSRVALVAMATCAVAGGAYWFYHGRDAGRFNPVAVAAVHGDASNVVAPSATTSAPPMTVAATSPDVTADVSKSSANMALANKATLPPPSGAENKPRSPDVPKANHAAPVSPPVVKSVTVAAASADAPSHHASPAVPAPDSAASGDDGTYSGRVCNFPHDPAKRICWKVPLLVTHGDGDGSWRLRSSGKPMHVHAIFAADGSVKATLDGWKQNDGTQITGAMNGKLQAGHIDMDGRWSSGLHVDGHWEHAH